MNYAYLRVSTKDKQEFTRQEFALKDYKIDKFFEEKISGTKKASDRPEFEKLLKVLEKGDTIYFESMSRMARSIQDLIDTTNLLSNKMGVRVVFIKENISISGQGLDAMNQLIFNIMGAFAQFERDLISDRTRQGLNAKKENGVVLGRPKKITNEQIEKVIELKSKKMKQKDIAKIVGLYESQVCRIIRGYYV